MQIALLIHCSCSQQQFHAIRLLYSRVTYPCLHVRRLFRFLNVLLSKGYTAVIFVRKNEPKQRVRFAFGGGAFYGGVPRGRLRRPPCGGTSSCGDKTGGGSAVSTAGKGAGRPESSKQHLPRELAPPSAPTRNEITFGGCHRIALSFFFCCCSI